VSVWRLAAGKDRHHVAGKVTSVSGDNLLINIVVNTIIKAKRQSNSATPLLDGCI
jgi:hypothetical protein